MTQPPEVYPLPRKIASEFRAVEVLPVAAGEADLVLVRDRKNRTLVVKHYRPGFQADQSVYDRVRNLRGHPAIITIHKWGSEAGRAYEVLDYFPRGTLADRWDGAPLRHEELTRFVVHLTGGISALHGVKIRHRDLKPANLLVRNSLVEPVITDFGISQAAAVTQRVDSPAATLHYAPPEVLSGTLSHEADWWALGMMVLELATGRHPFAGLNGLHVAAALSGWQPELGALPPRFGELCEGLLTRDRKRRWDAERIRRWQAAAKTAKAAKGAEAVPDRPAEPRVEKTVIVERTVASISAQPPPAKAAKPAKPAKDAKPAKAAPPAASGGVAFAGKVHTGKKSLAEALRKQGDQAARHFFQKPGQKAAAGGLTEAGKALVAWLRGLDASPEQNRERNELVARLHHMAPNPHLKVLHLLRWLDPGGAAVYRGQAVTVAAIGRQCMHAFRQGRPSSPIWGEILTDEEILGALAGFSAAAELEPAVKRLRTLTAQWRDLEALPQMAPVAPRGSKPVRYLLLMSALRRDKDLKTFASQRPYAKTGNHTLMRKKAEALDPGLGIVLQIMAAETAPSVSRRSPEEDGEKRRRRAELESKVKTWQREEQRRLLRQNRKEALNRHAVWTLVCAAPLTALAVYCAPFLSLGVQGVMVTAALYALVHLARGGRTAWGLGGAYLPPFPHLLSWRAARAPRPPIPPEERWPEALTWALMAPLMWLMAYSFPEMLRIEEDGSFVSVLGTVSLGVIWCGNVFAAYLLSGRANSWDGRHRRALREYEEARRALGRGGS